ncbi:MAG: hypothetical protein WA784_12600 [Albidovulum sp.]
MATLQKGRRTGLVALALAAELVRGLMFGLVLGDDPSKPHQKPCETA